MKVFVSLLLTLVMVVANHNESQANSIDSLISGIYFNLDACDAQFNNSGQLDYSEFTAEISNGDDCTQLEVLGGNLFRDMPLVNGHSCTPGLGGSPAMCVSSDPGCTYDPLSLRDVKIRIRLTPGTSGTGTLTSLSFYEKGPEEYDWINGASGPNNYPTLFSVRVLKNGTEIYLSNDLATAREWALREFNFSSNPEFTVTEPTIFMFELLGYCPVGNGATVSAWDLEDIRITSSCTNDSLDGGVITGGPFEFCVGDNIPDMVSGVELEGNLGSNSQWVITDDQGVILGLPPSPEVVDFDGAGGGLCLIWHLSFEDGLEGLEPGNNALTDLVGCYDFSNSIDVVRNQPDGGELSGGPFEFCVDDGLPDMVSGVELTGNVGTNSAYVVTDTTGLILGLPPSPEAVDFDGAGVGVCLIWHLSFEDGLTGLETGNNALTDLDGCYDLSNAVVVNRTRPDGGMLTGGPFEFCVGDGMPDMVTGIELTGNTGSNSAWVVTDTAGLILGLPPTPEAVDFDGAGPGICLIWHLSFEDGLMGAEMGNNAFTDLEGCYGLSNPVEVIRAQPEGGVLTGGPFEFCVGDDMPDMVTGIELSGNSGSNSQWVVTDTTGLILGLPPSPEAVDFNGAGPGVCLIWHLSFEDGLVGLEMGNNAATDLEGCYSLSNPVSVIRNEPNGGTLTGGPYEFCVGDGIPDMVTGVELTGNSGANSQWVVTDDQGLILGLPPSPEVVDFDGAGGGLCLIWHLSYADGLTGLEPGNNALTDLSGCFSFSNAVEVFRDGNNGGTLTGGPYQFCVADGMPDMITDLELSGNEGDSSQWVVTDTLGTILGLPGDISDVDFEAAAGGVCLVWNISFSSGLTGLEVGNNALSDLMGCYSLSNPAVVVRSQPDGGVLTGGPYEFCVGDGTPDTVSGLELDFAAGMNMQWVVTDTAGTILGLPPSPEAVDFDGAGPGVCLIWHLSFGDGLTGLEMGNNALTDLDGCYSFSNAIEVIRDQPEGGEITGGPFEFCVGNGEPDMVSGIELTGNSGENSQWVITDEEGIILGLPPAPDSVDFDGAGPGVCLIWHLSFSDGLQGAEPGNNAMTDLEGCYSLSNPIEVIRSEGDSTCGTGFVSEVFDVNVYPNPAIDQVQVEVTGDMNQECQVEIYDGLGRLLYRDQVMPGVSESIDLSNMPHGQMYIRVIDQGEQKVKAFIKAGDN